MAVSTTGITPAANFLPTVWSQHVSDATQAATVLPDLVDRTLRLTPKSAVDRDVLLGLADREVGRGREFASAEEMIEHLHKAAPTKGAGVRRFGLARRGTGKRAGTKSSSGASATTRRSLGVGFIVASPRCFGAGTE